MKNEETELKELAMELVGKAKSFAPAEEIELRRQCKNFVPKPPRRQSESEIKKILAEDAEWAEMMAKQYKAKGKGK